MERWWLLLGLRVMRNGCCCSGGGSTRKAFAWDEYIYPALCSMTLCWVRWRSSRGGMLLAVGGDVGAPIGWLWCVVGGFAGMWFARSCARRWCGGAETGW